MNIKLQLQENRENDTDDLREKMNNQRSAMEERIIKERQVGKMSIFNHMNLTS